MVSFDHCDTNIQMHAYTYLRNGHYKFWFVTHFFFIRRVFVIFASLSLLSLLLLLLLIFYSCFVFHMQKESERESEACGYIFVLNVLSMFHLCTHRTSQQWTNEIVNRDNKSPQDPWLGLWRQRKTANNTEHVFIIHICEHENGSHNSTLLGYWDRPRAEKCGKTWGNQPN